MMNNNGTITEIASLCTIGICIMTFLMFGITTGLWEPMFWISDIDDVDGQWGEDIIVTYADGTTESVKQISNNYWSTMSIENDGSSPISVIQYCLNVMIPVSDVFNTREYWCDVSIVQDGVEFYQTTYATTDSVNIIANEWTRIITVPLDIESVSERLSDGLYTVSFENAGIIDRINVPDGRSIDIAVEDGIVRFLI